MEDTMGDIPDGQSDSNAQTGGGADGNRSAGDDKGAYGGGQGPLTPAEQVAILDAQLEQGTGEFDTMILEEQQQQQRQSTRERPVAQAGNGTAGGKGSGGQGDTAASGSYGGGIGGVSGGGGPLPGNTAKYPPPADIPSGDDDDVVARQLREAAMREADPAVREKLWDEYRKYKGID
jgi:hypothetical protein